MDSEESEKPTFDVKTSALREQYKCQKMECFHPPQPQMKGEKLNITDHQIVLPQPTTQIKPHQLVVQPHLMIVKKDERRCKKLKKLSVAKSLEKFNSSQSKWVNKKALLDSDLLPGKLYQVVVLKKVHTRFGLRLLAEFPTSQLYFPQHMADKLDANDLEVINSAEYVYLTATREVAGNMDYKLVHKRQRARKNLAKNQ